MAVKLPPQKNIEKFCYSRLDQQFKYPVDFLPYCSLEFIKQNLIMTGDNDFENEMIVKILKPHTVTDIRREMRYYLQRAWQYSNTKKSMETMEAIQHYANWFYLLGETDLFNKFDSGNYRFYGKEFLEEVSDYLEVNHYYYDNGIRENYPFPTQ